MEAGSESRLRSTLRVFGTALRNSSLLLVELAWLAFESGWSDLVIPYEEAQALLGKRRCFAALDRAPEAVAPLAAAREIFARLGAGPALAETDDWLEKAGPA
jgi:hypothetical protein